MSPGNDHPRRVPGEYPSMIDRVGEFATAVEVASVLEQLAGG